MSYAFFPLEARSLEELSTWVNRELSAIASELKKYELVEYTAAPTQPFHGLKVIADGTTWNPGSGRGVYWYDSSVPSWKFMG